MTLNPVSGPAVEPVSLAEVKSHLRLGQAAHDDDPYIDALIKVAREQIDGRDGWLGRALISQTWDLSLDRFPLGCGSLADDWRRHQRSIPLPLPPVQSISQITYLDTDGVQQTVASSVYQLSADLNWRPRVDLAYGQSWPATRDEPDAVTVRFIAGYGGTGSDVPEPIRQALYLMIGHLYENRQDVVQGVSPVVMPIRSRDLLLRYRVGL